MTQWCYLIKSKRQIKDSWERNLVSTRASGRELQSTWISQRQPIRAQPETWDLTSVLFFKVMTDHMRNGWLGGLSKTKKNVSVWIWSIRQQTCWVFQSMQASCTNLTSWKALHIVSWFMDRILCGCQVARKWKRNTKNSKHQNLLSVWLYSMISVHCPCNEVNCWN